ncbi:diversity-generating retroelement protein Avd [Sediminicurvatus halobius]|uniref:Diversity-generating retroelement protein Avd n=1 Tax=Sediminicurvatus halobius TaxID=2182432 RepID=A0A2U2N1D5_9GAMM|nr:diversity-generating retroelement protein Avd [Spiribacter halobius]PWG62873.1 diversity-generating retroelement protein Avd [Spiribacter halobius]UEX76974.1 diversity-generating retroelement protein Avd [Spiribacter halobius]
MTWRPEEVPRQRGLVVVSKAERLIADLGPQIDRIPKHQRYRFAVRLEAALWELVRRLIEAATSGQKSKVYRADEQIRYLHALLRHGAERRLLGAKRVGEAAGQLSEIGAMVGAWRQRLK